MAFLQNTQYDFKMFGNIVTVPNNAIAKVMYYLDCVCTVVDYNENNIARYRNYSNWANMSDEEDKWIFCLAATLSPDEFEDKVFFQNDRLCPESRNQFYEIGQVRNQFIVAPSIVIGGRSRRVQKIMAYKQSWMISFYYEPMKELAERFSPRRPTYRTEICSIS